MENEFIPYEQAFFKRTGFDEPCLAYYDMRSFYREYPSAFYQTKASPIMGTRNSNRRIERL
jgi:hypothetical protein